MTPLFQQIITYALLPTLALTGRGLLALFIRFGMQARSAILHFAAGVVFSVMSVEILPDVIRLHDPILTAVGFGMGMGIGLMLLIRRLTELPRGISSGEGVTNSTTVPIGKSAPSFSVAFLLAIGVDIFIDGQLLGPASQQGRKREFCWHWRWELRSYRWDWLPPLSC